jgi:hypothetical protein
MFMHAESMAAERVFGTISGVHGKVAAIEAAAEVAFRFWGVSEDDRTTLRTDIRTDGRRRRTRW